jgi:hypothetical protein
MTSQVLGANVVITLMDANDNIIDPDQIPRFYISQQRQGTSIVSDYVTLTNESPGPFQQILDALTPYKEIAAGLASFVSGEPNFGSLSEIFTGFRDAIFGDQSNLNDQVSKFITKAMTIDIPYPHPSGLRKIKLHSTGSANDRWLLPNLEPNPETHETIFPGVSQRAGLLYVYENAGTEMIFDLEQIAQGQFWKVFFINDGENNRFFPIMYGFRDGDCAVVLVVNLRFIRYNWAPEIKTGIRSPQPSQLPDSVFVDQTAESYMDGYLPPNASIQFSEVEESHVVRWKNGRVSFGYNDLPQDNLQLYAKSDSVRLKYPGLGALRNWGIELEVESSPNLQGLPIYQFTRSSLYERPNSEGDSLLTQDIPGSILVPGVAYTFDLIIKDGDNSRRGIRRKVIKVMNPELLINSVTPCIIRRGEKVVLQGEFGYFFPPLDTAPSGTRPDAMLESVEVGDETVSWERRGKELVIGPITHGGVISLKFRDSTLITSTQNISFINEPPVRNVD